MRHPPAVRLDPAGEQGDERALPVTVAPNDADPVTGGHTEGDIVEQRSRPVRLAQTFNIDQIHDATKGSGIRPLAAPLVKGAAHRLKVISGTLAAACGSACGGSPSQGAATFSVFTRKRVGSAACRMVPSVST
ncbi:hypothetical protein GCM10023196_058660 [Actinoallomurus vinaceus]|uniref:Uncharacterized protein n=1 Tax=Actinoallomurus vinaceus TaxID=1080074 RepID=A0ABP8UFU6_9ACTN